MQTWKLNIEISVADCWVSDGFDLSQSDIKQEITDMVSSMLPYANVGLEIGIKCAYTSKPDKKQIRKLQGYEDR